MTDRHRCWTRKRALRRQSWELHPFQAWQDQAAHHQHLQALHRLLRIELEATATVEIREQEEEHRHNWLVY